MTSELLQKHPVKGTREFRLTHDEIQCSTKSPFKTSSLSVIYEILEVEPVRSNATLSFISKVNKDPLVELFLNKPNKEVFDQFVEKLRQKIIDNDFGGFYIGDKGVDINTTMLDESIEMLQKNVNPTEIKLLLSALIELKTTPHDVQLQKNVAKIFNELGFVQTQVLIYAPYLRFKFTGNRLETS